MNRLLFVLLLLITAAYSQAQQFDLDTIIFNGPIDNRVNLVFLGDGYLEEDLGQYISDVNKVTTDLFRQTPFKEYAAYFNVFAVKVPSKERGAATSPNKLINNYFGSTFNYAGIQRLLVPTKSSKVSLVLAQSFPTYDQVFVLVNSTTYGGSGGWIATSSVNTAASEIAIHEIGHSFSSLSDEYWAGSQYARESPNMTRITNKDAVRWNAWMGDNGIGIYEHSGQGSGWHKPHQGCKMQFLGFPFCSVCTETITEKVLSLVDPYDRNKVSPAIGAAVKITSDTLFRLGLVKPQPNTLKVAWLLDQAKVSTGLSYKPKLSALSNGVHSLKAAILDTSAFSRKGSIQSVRLHTLSWTIEKDIFTQIKPAEVQAHLIQIAPNPSSRFISIESETAIKVDGVFDLNGRKVKNGFDHKSQHHSINIINLSTGTYLLILEAEGALIRHRIFKQ